jgi:hypothetical protein
VHENAHGPENFFGERGFEAVVKKQYLSLGSIIVLYLAIATVGVGLLFGGCGRLHLFHDAIHVGISSFFNKLHQLVFVDPAHKLFYCQDSIAIFILLSRQEEVFKERRNKEE